MLKHSSYFQFLILSLMLALAGCGGSDKDTEARRSNDNGAAIDQYYRDRSEFFTFATPTEIPANLQWENGMDLPDIGSPDAKKGGTFVSAISDFPRTLRFVGPDSNNSFRKYYDEIRMSYAGMHPDKKELYYPGIAKEWAVDWDDRRVYVRIHPQAVWSDGQPITTDDAFYMFYFYQSEHLQAPWYNDFYTDTYENITRYDDQTFSIKVKIKKPDMPSYALGLSPLPRHFYGTLNEDFVRTYQWEFAPIVGAYILKDKDIKKGRSVTWTRNPNWWAQDLKFWRYRFNPDKIRLNVIRDSNKSIEAFKRGDLYLTGLNLANNWYEKVPNDLPEVQNGYIKKAIFYNDVPRNLNGLWLNTSKPLLNDIHIRKGLHYASNWQLVLEKFFRNDYERLQTTADGYGDMTHPNLTPLEFSPEKALAAFAEAGFAERGPDGILVNAQGNRLSFTVTTGIDSFEDMLAILKEEARKAGVEFNLEILDSTTAWKKIQEKNHEIAFSIFGTGSIKYPRYWQFFHSDNANIPQTNNLSNIANPELDERIDAYRDSDNWDEMRELAYKIEEIVANEYILIYGYKQPYFRCGYWRWVNFPAGFNPKHSDDPLGYHIHWIDEAIKQETQTAEKTGKSFGPSITTYDQYK